MYGGFRGKSESLRLRLRSSLRQGGAELRSGLSFGGLKPATTLILNPALKFASALILRGLIDIGQMKVCGLPPSASQRMGHPGPRVRTFIFLDER